MIIGKDGQPLVVIIGGVGSNQKGMELWNPRTHKVELLWDIIPPEEGGTQGLKASEMVILKGGQELLLYGGLQGSYQDGIWQYISASNTWKRYSVFPFNLYFQQLILYYHFRVGGLLTARQEHVTLAVSGIECP